MVMEREQLEVAPKNWQSLSRTKSCTRMAYSPHVAVDLGFDMGEGEAGRPEDQGLVPQLFGHEYGERRQDLRYPASAGGFQIHHPVINQPVVRGQGGQL